MRLQYTTDSKFKKGLKKVKIKNPKTVKKAIKKLKKNKKVLCKSQKHILIITASDITVTEAQCSVHIILMYMQLIILIM